MNSGLEESIARTLIRAKGSGKPASSMLTVAIFSASTMVSSFGAVASSATPRASQLLIEDTTIQNTLAAFIGAFIYSVIALVGLHDAVGVGRAHLEGVLAGGGVPLPAPLAPGGRSGDLAELGRP